MVSRMHLCRDGAQRHAFIPGRLRNRSDLQNLQVINSPRYESILSNKEYRILGTPNEENWPGVRQLPDYKGTFPQWSTQDLARIVPELDEDGIDFLTVC